MSFYSLDMMLSALTEYNPLMPTDQFMPWLRTRREAHRFTIEQIRFRDLKDWFFEPSSGNLSHCTGRFFKIEGIWVETNYGCTARWSQPIIHQPEIGILGIIIKRVRGVLYFLMQAKMEPGNLNMVQLAPTVQATRSNFTQVHKGLKPRYLEYFLDGSRSRVVVDILQSEQGARFLRKRNRNIVIEIEDEIKVGDDFCWLTLGQIKNLILMDNIINMDARTVLSCIPFGDRGIENMEYGEAVSRAMSAGSRHTEGATVVYNAFCVQLFKSALRTAVSVHATEDIISWFTDLKFRYILEVERIPLKHVHEWVKTDEAIVHRDGRYFSVIAARVEADSREVPAWSQPLVKPREEGVVAFIVKPIDGVLHFLVQAKVEAGNFDVVEMAPTVQCLTGSYRQVPHSSRPPFLDYVLQARPEQVRHRTMQSEEGGRFLNEQNLNIIVEADEAFPEQEPEHYRWMTLNQLQNFIKYNNFVNVQARCLLSCLSFRNE